MKRDAPDVHELQPGENALCAPPEVISAALGPLVSEARHARIEQVVAGRMRSVVVVLEELADPHNGAAVLRTADALGVHEIHLIAKRHTFLVASGVSKGAARWLEIHRHGSAAECVHALRARGYDVLVAAMDGDETPGELRRHERVAIVFGNEHSGVTPELRALATGSYRVPMRGFVESLNVSVAAAITLYAAAHDRPGDLHADERRELRARYLLASVDRAEDIVGEWQRRNA